jgi:hypothetical protein
MIFSPSPHLPLHSDRPNPPTRSSCRSGVPSPHPLRPRTARPLRTRSRRPWRPAVATAPHPRVAGTPSPAPGTRRRGRAFRSRRRIRSRYRRPSTAPRPETRSRRRSTRAAGWTQALPKAPCRLCRGFHRAFAGVRAGRHAGSRPVARSPVLGGKTPGTTLHPPLEGAQGPAGDGRGFLTPARLRNR